MNDPAKRPVVGDGTDASDPLVARLARSDGPEVPGPAMFDEVAARVERRADRRRSGFRAVGALAALALAGGTVVGLVRSTSGSSDSSAASAASPTDRAGFPAAGSGAPPGASGAVTPGSAAGGTAGEAAGAAGSGAQAAGCPATLPSVLPAPTFAAATERLVPAAPGARVVICAYPLPIADVAGVPEAPTAGSSAASAAGPASPAAPVVGARAVSADTAWLARVGALPASTDPRPASTPMTCLSTGRDAGPVYLVRLAYPTGGQSWLRVIAGRCQVYADNGAATSTRAEGLLAEVRAAYEAGSPLR